MKLRSLLLKSLAVSAGCLLSQSLNVQAAAFTPGNLVVYRVGTGTAALSNASAEVFLDEYSAAGTLVQSIPLPTADSGANQSITASGSATSGGLISRSSDGQYVIVTGYDSIPGVASITGSATTSVTRVIGRVAADGSVNSATTTTSFSADNIRGATSVDGSAFWASGANTGIIYQALGGSGAGTIVSSSVTNNRSLGIFGGQLYVSSGSGTNTFRGVNAVGTGLPTTTGQTTTRLPGMNDTDNPSSYQFFFADLDAGVAGNDTLYIADDGAGALTKWSLVGGTWTKNNTIGVTADDYRGLTGSVNGATVTLYATRDNSTGADTLVSLVDATGYNAAMTATPTLVATAAANTAFRGVVFAPAAPVSTPTLTIAATDASAAELGTDTGTFRISRTGDTTNALSVSYTLTTGAGQAVAADYTPALTGTATIAATQSFVDVAVTPVDDFVLEGGETIALTLTDTVDYDLGATTTASVTITDDETNIDLSRYVRVGRYDLPEPTRTTPPSGNLLGQEASGVAYNWDTDTLFIVGDGGTSVTEVTKAGALVSTMTLSGNGTDFLDTEGITYIGGGQFVLTEERVRQAVKFTYVAGGTLTNATAERVKLGTTIGNIGLEGLSYDPQTSGFLFAKESDPQGLFQTTIDFTAGTASNGSAATVNSTNLFTPALASLDDMSDVFAFSNLAAMTGQAQSGNLLILSQESGLIRHVDRSGNIQSTLTLVADAGNPLTIQNQTHEGVTMDREGRIYVVSENGGGDIDHPQLWVFAPAAVVNTAPTAIVLSTASTTIPESTSTAAAVKMANFTVTDVDGVGVNSFSVSGTDAADFQVIGSALYLKSGTVLNGTTKQTYTVTVNVDDTSVGATPDASANFTLNVTPVISGSSAIRITEVAPWSSGNSPDVTADWFELTNTGTTAIDITGWLMFDSGAPAGAGPLNGITTIAAGESVIFVDGQSKISGFLTNWFGASPPSGLQVGYYGGPGLSTGGDSVTIFNPSGTLQARVDFGASPSATPFGTFDNTAGLNNATISQLSAVGQNGAFSVTSNTLPPVTTITEIGSPGSATISSTVFVSITATDANAAEASTDSGTFRISRTGSTTLSMDVLYGIATGSGQAVSDDYTPALGTTATIPAGASFVDVTITPVDDSSIEGSETLTLTLGDTGSYDVGSPASAMVTIIDNDVNLPPTAVAFANTVAILSESANTAADVRVADITVTDDGNGTNTLSVSGTDAASFSITGTSLYLKAGAALSFATKPSYSVTVNVDDTTVGITPDLTANFNLAIAQAVAPGALVITEVHSSGSSATYAADWFELQNVGTTDLTITGWKMDDNSNGTPSTTQVALRGLTVIPAGKSAVFFEGLANGSTDATILANFCTAWFGSSTPPAGVLIGAYGGSGIGLGAGGDALNIFDAAGNRITGVAFGAATVGTTFNNKSAALGSATLPLPTISTLSVIGTNGAFRSAANTETGSPGSTVTSSYFPQSVASGDPRSSSVVLWTRVLDGHTAANREVSLHLSTTGTLADVGTTAALGGTNVWTGGTLTAQSAHDGVVKVKVGSLTADTTYYYQFTYNGQRSPIGRTKTAPAAGSTRTVKYAAINCNDFVGRYFNVLRQLAEREQNSIDFVLNLGDYVYETTGDPSFQTSLPERSMVFSNPAEAINLGSGNYAAQSVGNYRDIYKTIRQDAQLQRVHELFPMISIWDDHEFSDDNWKDNATYFDDKVNEQQTNRKKNGEQAWMEFLPTERGMASTGNGLEIDSTDLYPNTVIYDAFNFGSNLDLILTDIRTNRADHLIPENAIPSGIPMTEANVIATLAAVNGLDVPTFTAAVWPSIRSNFASYVNLDDSAYAAVKGVYKAIMAASANSALAALPAGQTAITTGAAYADAQVVGFQDANFINQAFVAAGQTAPFDAAALAAMPRGLSYYLLGKTSVFSDFGSRYQVVNQTFQLFAGYTYQAFLLSSGALGRDQAFYDTAQQTFLATALANSTAAGNKWRVVASSTPYTPIKLELGDLPNGLTLPTQGTISGVTIPASLPSQFLVEFLLNADEPAGFPQFRQGMIDLFAQHDAIIVSGDIHAELIGKNNATNGQKVVDFTVPSASSSEFRRAVSGAFTTVEGLMTPGVQAATGLPGSFAFDSAQKQAVINATDSIIKHNTPEMFQADTAAHGYTVFTAGASAFNADYQKINVSEIGNNHYALSSAALDALFQKENFTVTKTGSGATSDLNLGVPQNNTTIIIGDATMSEGNSGTSTLNFTVTRSDLLGDFTVDFATSSGTATAGSDFTATSGTLTFTAGGDTTQNVSISITGDTTVEPNETFVVTLSNVVNTAGTAAITDATATGTLTNDDTTVTFATWLAENGFSGTAGGDTDSDGVPDSLEYFFNSSPNSGGDRDNLPTVTMNGADLEFRFTYLNNTVFTGFLQCSEDLINWANATPGVDYEVITETANGVETAVRYRIFCNPLPTTQGPFSYMTPFTAEVERGAIDQLSITNHGMVGAGRISGDALDSFGETQGAASGLSITGWSYNSGTGQFNGTFNVLPDRGYNSGSIFSNYAARIHAVPFTFMPYYGASAVAQTQIVPTYSSTTKFTYLDGATTKFTTGLNAVAVNTIMEQSVGTAPAANGPGGATTNLISFDAEAIHVFADGSGFVSDEYGAYIARFNSAKQFTKLIQLPAAAQPHRPAGTLNYDAVTTPTNGRRNNQGLEGLSVSPDNSRLFALMQSALVQDGVAAQTRFNTRLFVYNIAGANIENPVLIGEYVVQLPRYDLNGNNSGLDVTAAQSEIVALSSTQFLMLPRDGNGLGKSTSDPIVTKTVDLVDFGSATNVLGLYDAVGNAISPSGVLRAGITPAKSTVVINLLSSTDLMKFGFNTNTTSPNQFTVAEKAEGMALVPDTSTPSTEDYFLFVANDNDFQSSDVKMLDATGNIVSYGDARSSVSGSPKITNDAVFTAWRITICPNNRKFFKIALPGAP